MMDWTDYHQEVSDSAWHAWILVYCDASKGDEYLMKIAFDRSEGIIFG